jgi:ketoreductase RED2
MDESRRRAVVTGSSQGIGAEIARALAGDGFAVVVNSSGSVEAGEALAAEIGGTYLRADVSDPGEALDLIDGAAERLGGLDLVVNAAASAAVIPHADLEAADAAVWEETLGVTLLAPWWTTVAAAPHLRRAADGQVINISSTSATRAEGSSLPYAVAKAGLEQMTRLLAKALGPEIRVNALAPGLIDTPRSADWDAAKESVAARVALRRVGRPEDIAAACRLLLGATYMTGTVVTVDGGLSLL